MVSKSSICKKVEIMIPKFKKNDGVLIKNHNFMP